MNISDLVKQAHETAKEKGRWDREPSFGELIALCHSELSEALEEYRVGHSISEPSCDCDRHDCFRAGRGCQDCPELRPEGIPIELADVIIRIADMCGHYGIDLESAIKQKMEYNKGRPYRHGGKVI